MADTALGERLERSLRARAAKAGAIAAVRLQTDLVRNFQPHRKSGETQERTSVRLESLTATTITYIARADTPQAKWVNDGTPRHPIRGNPWLVFYWARVGRVVRFHEVDHPGYRGDGWWDHTIAFWPFYVEDAWAQAG